MATSRNEGLTTVAIPDTNGILVDLCDALSGAPTLDELHDRWGSSSRRRLGLSRQQWHNPATVDLVDAIAQGRDLTEALRAVGEARAWAGLSLDETLADLGVLAGLVPSSASAEALALRSRASAGWTRCAPHPWWARPGPSPSTAGPSPSSSPRGFDAAVMDPDSDDGRLMAQAYRSLPERWQPPGGLVRVVAVVVQRRHCRPAVSTHAGGLRARREAVADSRRRGAEVCWSIQLVFAHGPGAEASRSSLASKQRDGSGATCRAPTGSVRVASRLVGDSGNTACPVRWPRTAVARTRTDRGSSAVRRTSESRCIADCRRCRR